MDPLLVWIVSQPVELRSAIVSKTSLPVLRIFRLVCVQNRFLYHKLYQIITDDINKGDTLT